jgi:Cu+-exporting ATPase
MQTLPTCASCVNRIERYLGRAEGVTAANVNLATERATVRFDPGVIDRAGIVATIEAAGYEVAPDRSATTDAAADEARDEEDRAAERRDLLVGALVSLAVGLAMMAVMFWPG